MCGGLKSESWSCRTAQQELLFSKTLLKHLTASDRPGWTRPKAIQMFWLRPRKKERSRECGAAGGGGVLAMVLIRTTANPGQRLLPLRLGASIFLKLLATLQLPARREKSCTRTLSEPNYPTNSPTTHFRTFPNFIPSLEFFFPSTKRWTRRVVRSFRTFLHSHARAWRHRVGPRGLVLSPSLFLSWTAKSEKLQSRTLCRLSHIVVFRSILKRPDRV